MDGELTDGDGQCEVAETGQPAEPDEVERQGGLRLLSKGLAEGDLSNKTAVRSGHELERCQLDGRHSDLPALHKPHEGTQCRGNSKY